MFLLKNIICEHGSRDKSIQKNAEKREVIHFPAFLAYLHTLHS